jgi:uncharacterized protein
VQGPYKVIDCNRHVVEPPDLWEKRLPAPLHQQVRIGPGRLDRMQVRGRAVLGGRPNFFTDPLYQQVLAEALQADFSPQSNLADMDRQGIDVGVLLPLLGLYAPWADHIGPDLSVPMCQVYNDWLHEYCQTDAARLKGVALLPLQDPGEAATELRRAVQALRCVAGLMLPNPVIGRRLHDGAYDVLYREAETLGVPLVVSHGGSGMVLPQVGQDRWPAFYAREVAVDTFEAWLAVASFMGHNVLERFPTLHVGFIGAGCGWLPYWLERLEEHWGGFFGQDAPSTQAPDRLFKAQGFAACDSWERTLPEVVEAMGERTVVWGSQYPLPDILHFFPHEVDIIVEDQHLAEEAKQRTLWENAADLFHIREGQRS